MKPCLGDVNVFLALLVVHHPHHEIALRWNPQAECLLGQRDLGPRARRRRRGERLLEDRERLVVPVVLAQRDALPDEGIRFGVFGPSSTRHPQRSRAGREDQHPRKGETGEAMVDARHAARCYSVSPPEVTLRLGRSTLRAATRGPMQCYSVVPANAGSARRSAPWEPARWAYCARLPA